METLWQDLRYGSRMLMNNRGLTAVAVLTMALGIGANTTIFTMVKAVVLDPLPGVQEYGGLTILYTTFSSGRFVNNSYPDYLDYRGRSDLFASLIASSPAPLNMSGGDGQPERIWGEIVSGNFFEVLGVKAALGRTLSPEDDQTPGAHQVVVISYGLWQNRFGSDPNIIGTTLKLNSHIYTVVGVAQKGFNGSVVGVSLDLYVPLMMQAQVLPFPDSFNNRGMQWLEIKGRLGPGVTLQRARPVLKTVASQLAQDYPKTNRGHSAALFWLSQAPIGAQSQLLPVLVVLMAVVGLVLLIACANVAGLLLARAAARRREIAVRLAMGASRIRIIRQLLTESIVLSLSGGVAGLLFAFWLTNLMTGVKLPVTLPIKFDLSANGQVLVFTFALSFVTGMICGLMPALQASKPDLVFALKAEGKTLGRGYRKSRLLNLLVTAQAAICLILLVGAGLLVRSLQHNRAADPGFDPRNVLAVSLDLRSSGYDQNKGKEFFRHLVERVESLPGVRSASLVRLLPLSLAERWTRTVEVEGYAAQPNEDMSIAYNEVGPGYLSTMGIPVVQGRDFTVLDKDKAPGAAIINETMGRLYWPGQDPVGKRVHTGGQWLTVIGIAKDSSYYDVEEAPSAHLYLPFLQNYEPEMTVLARTETDPMDFVAAVREQIGLLDANLAIFNIKTLTEQVNTALAGTEAVATLMGGVGLVALMLATVGIYGVVAYAVSQRTQEFGIRMALGAQPRDVLKLIMKGALATALVGSSIGLAGAFALARVMSSFLMGVSASDPAVFAAASMLIVGVLLLASYVPARRAVKVDPVVALRYE